MKRFLVLAVAVLGMKLAKAQTSKQSNNMKDSAHVAVVAASLQDVYTVFLTTDVKKCRDFYASWFGFTPVFESSWFILLISPGEKSFSLAFMNEEHPSFPPAPKAMKGDGAFITLQVADAKKVYEAMVKSKATISYHLKDEDWGQRRFAVIDPNGMHVDVVEQIDPKPGFWDAYMQ